MSYVNILTWSEIKYEAHLICDEWIDCWGWTYQNLKESELKKLEYLDLVWIQRIASEGFLEGLKKAWETLVQAEIVSYRNDTEYCKIMIMFIALVEIYAEFYGFDCMWVGQFEESYLEVVEYLDIDISYLYPGDDTEDKIDVKEIISSIRNNRKFINELFKGELGNLVNSINQNVIQEVQFLLEQKTSDEDDEFQRQDAESIYYNNLIDKITKRWKEVVMDEVTLASQKLTNFFKGQVINLEESAFESTSQHPQSSQAIILLHQYVEPSFTDIERSVLDQGIHISQQTLRRYHLALKTRKFLILAGISGTGKTLLTKTYADAVEAEYLVVPVAPNWTTNEDLLGYFNPMDKHYYHTAFSHFLQKAAEEYKLAQASNYSPCPYHLVLDEMNLARVEYYFAKFLSAMEVRMREEVADIELAPGKKVLLPPNLYFIGTVNMDETTHGFADKVYDRAQLIELEVSRQHLYEYLGEVEYRDTLMLIWDKVHTVAPFAFRVLDEIKTYVKQAEALELSWEEAFDEQLLQKILPKLKGTDDRVGEALNAVVEIAHNNGFQLSHKKAKKMLETFNNHGFISYF
jgi:AAA domain (dynein-related subfamily)